MKNNSFILFLKYSAISIFILLFAYPILHELGHIFGALSSGGKIVSASFFPIPSVSCVLKENSAIQTAFISTMGLVIPIILFCIFPANKKSKTTTKFALFLFEIIIIFSLSISLVYAYQYNCNNPIMHDDITTMLNSGVVQPITLIAFLLFAIIITICMGIYKKTYLVFNELKTI